MEFENDRVGFITRKKQSYEIIGSMGSFKNIYKETQFNVSKRINETVSIERFYSPFVISQDLTTSQGNATQSSSTIDQSIDRWRDAKYTRFPSSYNIKRSVNI